MDFEIFIPIFVSISVIINVVVIKLILGNKEQTNQKMTWLLVGNMASIGLWVVITSFQTGSLSQETNQVGFTISAAISNLLILFGIMLLSIFITYLIQPSTSLPRMLFLTGTLTSVAVLYLVMIISAANNNQDTVDLTLLIVNIINLVVIILFLIWAHQDINQFLTEIKGHYSTVQVKRFYYALIIGFLGNIPVFLLAWFVDQGFLSLTYLLIPISLSFLAYNYYKDPRVAFILSERTYLTIIANTQGGLKYERQFWNFKGNDFTIIISGVLNAVTDIMSEFYDHQVRPHLIEFENKRILLKWQQNYFLAVFTDRDSPLIRTAMEKTVREINLAYGDKLSNVMTTPNVLDLDKIFNNSFYFVIPS